MINISERCENMSIRALDFLEPFFSMKYVLGETEYAVGEKSIVLNLSSKEGY